VETLETLREEFDLIWVLIAGSHPTLRATMEAAPIDRTTATLVAVEASKVGYNLNLDSTHLVIMMEISPGTASQR
jgi:hypothetical protein